MSEAQDSLTAGNSRPASSASPAPVPSRPSGPVTMGFGGAWGEPPRDDDSGLGGHTLLSRPSVSQGRRTLFRR